MNRLARSVTYPVWNCICPVRSVTEILLFSRSACIPTCNSTETKHVDHPNSNCMLNMERCIPFPNNTLVVTGQPHGCLRFRLILGADSFSKLQLHQDASCSVLWCSCERYTTTHLGCLSRVLLYRFAHAVANLLSFFFSSLSHSLPPLSLLSHSLPPRHFLMHRDNYALEGLATKLVASSSQHLPMSEPQGTSNSSSKSQTKDHIFEINSTTMPELERTLSYQEMIWPHCEPGLRLGFAAAAFAWAVRDYLAGEEANRLAAMANQLALASICISNVGVSSPSFPPPWKQMNFQLLLGVDARLTHFCGPFQTPPAMITWTLSTVGSTNSRRPLPHKKVRRLHLL